MTPRDPIRLRGVPVLMLHGLCETVPDHVCFDGSRTCMIPVEAFERMLDWCRRHFDIVRVADLDLALKPGSRARPMLVTFDDALASVVDYGAPMLKAHGESAVAFVTTQWTDSGRSPFIFDLERLVFEREPAALHVNVDGTPWSHAVGARSQAGRVMAALWNWLFDQKFAPLALRPDQTSLDQRVVSEADLDWDGGPWVPASWDALREAVAGGAIEIGSHMASHTPLNWLDEAALVDETVGSRTRLEREFSRPVTTCAYPHGKCSPLAAGVAHRAFEWSFINRGGLTTSVSDRSMAPRIHVPGEGWGRVGRDLRFRSWDSTGLTVKVAHALDALVRSVARVRPGAR